MIKYVVFLFLLSLSALSFAQPAKLALCAACHGAKGDAPIAPNYPKLAGQNAAYTVAALKAYKNGERKGALAAVMSGQAVGLSDAEMQELAAYFAAQ